MTLNKITGMFGRRDSLNERDAKQEQIAKLMRNFDNRVRVNFVAVIPPSLAERLQNLVNAVPSLTNRVVILTGMAAVLEQCEQTPDLVDSTLKLGSYESRATVSLNLRIPAELDERLTKLVKSHPKLKRRDVAAAGLDWILARCEAANGGLFTPNPALAPS